MTPTPIALLSLIVIILGGIMMSQYLRGKKRHPLMIGAHILLAIGTLEGLVVLLQRGLGGAMIGNTNMGEAAGFILGLGLLSALISAVMRGRSTQGAKPLFFAHAALGATGVALLLIWTASV